MLNPQTHRQTDRTEVDTKKTELKGMFPDELETFVSELGPPSYRARQIAAWIYNRGVTAFDDMTDQAKPLRADLAAQASVSPVGGTVFWPAYKMRGMAELLIDLATNPEMAFALLDVVTGICSRLAAKLATYDLDILNLADDFGTQRALMVRPEDWRVWFKDRLRTVIDAAKSIRPEVLIVFHSDGKIDEIIPDLIEIGVDVLNPLQPEVMDPAAIKRAFGKDLALWGGSARRPRCPLGPRTRCAPRCGP